MERSELTAAYESADDATLIARLRKDGDSRAYEMLWRRHIDAALLVVRRVAPLDAEDLASEAFQAVHHNIVDMGKAQTIRSAPTCSR